MSRRLVGEDPTWRPQAFLRTRPPAAFVPRRSISDVWNGVNPYRRPEDQLGPQAGFARNPNVAALARYNQAARQAVSDANQETGQNYLTSMSTYAPGAPQQLGGEQMARIHARVPIADGSMVSIPMTRAMGGHEGIATPEDLARRYRNAQIIQGGFGPLEGLLGVAGFGLGLPGGLLSGLIGKLPAGLQTAAKVAGGLKSASDLVTSRGRSGPGTILGAIGTGYRP